MTNIIDFPAWPLLLVWPVLATVLLAVWLLTRGRSSSLRVSGFGVTLELSDTTQPHGPKHLRATEEATDGAVH